MHDDRRYRVGRGGDPDQARHRGAGPGHGGRQRREGQQQGGAQVSPGQDPGSQVRIPCNIGINVRLHSNN